MGEAMLPSIAAVVAAIAGILVGFWLRGKSARTENAQLEMHAAELTHNLESAKADLAQLQAESASRAGYQALAGEREKALVSVREELQSKAESERVQGARIKELEAELRNERQNIAEKIALLETAKQTLSNQFQTLATEILESKSKTFSETSQTQLGTLLEPLKTQIKDFREKVEQAQSDSKTGVTRLETLVETLGALNKSLTEEAHNLSTALRRDTKMQGNWGETILRNILEKSGLQEGLHYTFQQNFAAINDDGEIAPGRQTDVVVKMPSGRHLIIDSKVSLNAYNDSVNASSEKDRTDALRRHIASIRNHFGELSSRNYQNLRGLESPDFVVMFVPIEPAFLIALQSDEKVWFDAYQKKVLLCGPTTVLFVIRIVVDLWRQEQQARNVKDVMKRGQLLYDKFVGFVADMERIGKGIQQAKDIYGDAMDKLTKADGNLIGQVEKLKHLGVRSSKSLPQNLLDAAADDEEPLLSLAAEADQNGGLDAL